MKVKRYIKPQIEVLQMDFAERLMGQTWDHGDANEGQTFDEDFDDEYDPFFDE